MSITKTGGTWDFNAWPVYFAAANMDTVLRASSMLHYMLIAINDFREADLKEIYKSIEDGKHILIDSGVFNLANSHAKNHGMKMDDALGLAPEKIDGFNALFEKYTTLLRELGPKCWGYIEIDQGGKENKTKTRERLEMMGFNPIPVYHPFNDGWDYFDFLAQRYDRICLGNVVQANAATRKRLIATIWERRRKYPHLWIHALGLTPSDLTTAFPMNSCDSSSWVSALRWANGRFLSSGQQLSGMPQGFVYHLGKTDDEGSGRKKANLLCGYDAEMLNRVMHTTIDDQREGLGTDCAMYDVSS